MYVFKFKLMFLKVDIRLGKIDEPLTIWVISMKYIVHVQQNCTLIFMVFAIHLIIPSELD